MNNRKKTGIDALKSFLAGMKISKPRDTDDNRLCDENVHVENDYLPRSENSKWSSEQKLKEIIE